MKPAKVCVFFYAVLLAMSLVIGTATMCAHKRAMERIAGHPITWWDAFWTK